MDVADQDPPHRRLPTLVQLCQRAAVANIDAIYSLGDTLAYPLVKPVLEECSPEQLVRFEQLSPHLRKDTPEIWKDLCFRKYRLTAVERYSFDDDPQEPDSWKSRYFDAEAKRIEEVGSRIRSQRREADERKKEKEVKYTDRVPPPKRPRMGACKRFYLYCLRRSVSFGKLTMVILPREHNHTTEEFIPEN
ncbi:hypothetical protein NLJ89_g12263 [Agrocybe chaxingu]|uniref:Elongin-A n=1 Tax=Agrocybe chaxingu TaxID=84603 RepID=A0A9W8JKB8_9AGAR|nr:hypothetical protein NLJ89_g12263 [Agrocybe chaxingu]